MSAERKDGPLGFGPEEEEPAGGEGQGPPGGDDVAEQERRWAHRIDPDYKADLEGRPRPGAEEEQPSEPAAARIGGPYSAMVGVLFLLFLIFVGINTVTNRGGGTLGQSFSAVEWPLPQFAVPEARSGPLGDANVAQDDCEVSQLPCPAANRRRPACRVPGPGVIRVCDFFGRPLVLSFWFTRGGNCERQQDVVDRVAGRYRGRVGFLSLNVRDERAIVRRLIARRGWRMPVGHDADGAVSNLYRVGGCPTLVFAYPGGISRGANIGELDERRLSRRVDALIRASRDRRREGR